MNSTDRARRVRRSYLAVLALSAFYCDTHAAWADAVPQVVLRAAAAQGTSGIEVRLRWSLTDGWLPDGGFNLYRSDRSTPLNPAPLGASGSTASDTQINIGASKPLQVGRLLNNARQVPQGVTLPPLAVVLQQPVSSELNFQNLAPQTQATSQIPSFPAVNAATTIQSSSAVTTTLPVPLIPTTPPSAAETTLAARKALVLAAALHPAVSNALGLGFDDTGATPGQTYTYTLRPISSGSEGAALATVTITVPTDMRGLKPPAPTELRTIQTGPASVALRWQRLTPDAETQMGVAKYDIYRSGENITRQKLNSVPVLVADLGVPGVLGAVSNLHESAAFFTDTAPVIGRVEYDLVVTDIFGRSSDPARIVMTVADLRKPRVVPFAGAQLQALPTPAVRKTFSRARPFNITVTPPPPQPVLVAWQASPDSGVAYQIYRIDTEQANQSPQLLTVTPVTGTNSSASTLPAGSIADALAAQECLQQAHAGKLLNLELSLGLVHTTTSGTKQSGTTLSSGSPSCNLAQLPGDQRTVLQQTLLSYLQVLTYADSTAQKDHYYRYFVAAIFTRNAQQATPVQTNIVAYPDLTPPVMPTGVAAAFQASTSGQSTAGQVNATSKGTTRQLTDWRGPIVKMPPRDTGGTMALKWQGSSGAARYEVYRANVTRVTSPPRTGSIAGSGCTSTLGSSQPSGGSQSTGSQPTAANSVPAMFGGHPVTASMPVCIRIPSLASVMWQVPPKDSDFVLLGTTHTTEYDDALSRSSAHYYQYRIVPVNRWNVAGAMASIDARAPATQPPTAPKLLVGAASSDGGAQVEFLPDEDPGEEVVRYELWRSTILTYIPQSTATGSSLQSSAASADSQTTLATSAQAAGGSATLVRSSTAAQSATTTISATTTSSLSGSTLPKVALGPASGQLAGTAARYGLVFHDPIVSSAARSGASASSSLQASLLQAQKVAAINTADLPAGSNTGAWISDAPAGLDWRKDYAYVVKAIDKDGLDSASEPVDVTPLKVKAGAPSNVAASWNTTGCAVDVTWQSTDPDTADFIVERQLLTPAASAPVAAGTYATAAPSVTSKAPAAIFGGTVAGTAQTSGGTQTQSANPDYVQLSELNPTTRYVDFSVFPDNSYLYRVRAVDKARNMSAPTAAGQSVAVPDGCGNTPSAVKVASTPPATTSTPASNTLASPTPIARPQAPTISAAAAAASIPINGVTTITFRFKTQATRHLSRFHLLAGFRRAWSSHFLMG